MFESAQDKPWHIVGNQYAGDTFSSLPKITEHGPKVKVESSWYLFTPLFWNPDF